MILRDTKYESRSLTPREIAHAARMVGKRLRALRTDQDLTLTELSKRSGVDVATISRIETGSMTGTLESHIKLVAGLGVRMADFYTGFEEECAITGNRRLMAKIRRGIREAQQRKGRFVN